MLEFDETSEDKLLLEQTTEKVIGAAFEVTAAYLATNFWPRVLVRFASRTISARGRAQKSTANVASSESPFSSVTRK